MSSGDAGTTGTRALDLTQVDVFRNLDLRGLPRRLALAIAVNSLREMDRGALLCALMSDAETQSQFAGLPEASPRIDLVTRESTRDGHLHILRRRLAI
jgi:hypothetical protein